jgi:iron(III) transport system substrate-binding protein
VFTLSQPISGALSALSIASVGNVQAEEKLLNIYSARHYQTDEALYGNFTKQTGIKINRIEGKEEELLERIKNEGATARPTCSSPSTPRASPRPTNSACSRR